MRFHPQSIASLNCWLAGTARTEPWSLGEHRGSGCGCRQSPGPEQVWKHQTPIQPHPLASGLCPHCARQNLSQRFVLISSVSASLGHPHCPPRHWAETGLFSQHLLSTLTKACLFQTNLLSPSHSRTPGYLLWPLDPVTAPIPARPSKNSSLNVPLPSPPPPPRPGRLDGQRTA